MRLQGVGESGLVVDDPYGHEKLLPGTKHKWLKPNLKTSDTQGVYGKANVWPWDQVAKHNMLCGCRLLQNSAVAPSGRRNSRWHCGIGWR